MYLVHIICLERLGQAMKPPRHDSQPHLVALCGKLEDFSLPILSQNIYKFETNGSEAYVDKPVVQIDVQ